MQTRRSQSAHSYFTFRLGIAYVGSHRADLLELLLPILQDDGLSIEVQALAALSLGFIFVGSANGDIAGVILQLLMEKEEADLSSKWTKFVAVGLALLYVGRWHCQPRYASSLTPLSRPPRSFRRYNRDPQGQSSSRREAGAHSRRCVLVRWHE